MPAYAHSHGYTASSGLKRTVIHLCLLRGLLGRVQHVGGSRAYTLRVRLVVRERLLSSPSAQILCICACAMRGGRRGNGSRVLWRLLGGGKGRGDGILPIGSFIPIGSFFPFARPQALGPLCTAPCLV